MGSGERRRQRSWEKEGLEKFGKQQQWNLDEARSAGRRPVAAVAIARVLVAFQTLRPEFLQSLKTLCAAMRFPSVVDFSVAKKVCCHQRRPTLLSLSGPVDPLLALFVAAVLL